MALKNLTAKLLSLRRFSLRTGLIAFIALSIGMGLLGRWVQRVREQGEAQEWLLANGQLKTANWGNDPLIIEYAPEDLVSWTTRQVRKWVHPEFNRKLKEIHLTSPKKQRDVLLQIEKIADVESIGLYYPSSKELLSCIRARGLKTLWISGSIQGQETVADWGGIQNATQLDSLDLVHEAFLSDDLCAALSKLPKLNRIKLKFEDHQSLPLLAQAAKLEELEIWGALSGGSSFAVPMVTASRHPEVFRSLQVALDELSKRDRLRILKLRGFAFEDATLWKRFCESAVVQEIELDSTEISAPCIREFAKLNDLKTLKMLPYSLQEDQMEALCMLKQVTSLQVASKRAPETKAKLQKALPNCNIVVTQI